MTWQGVTANYTDAERQAMTELRGAGANANELAVIHLLVGLLDARPHDIDEREHTLKVGVERELSATA